VRRLFRGRTRASDTDDVEDLRTLAVVVLVVGGSVAVALAWIGWHSWDRMRPSLWLPLALLGAVGMFAILLTLKIGW
jgi:hypothetical protein